MLNSKQVITVAILCALAASRAYAADGIARDFERIDSDGNGELSWPEFEARGSEVFYFADLDSDGYLSRGEAPPGLARRFDSIDANGDDRLGADEVEAEHKRMFDAADRDRNGELTREEVDALPRPRNGGSGRSGAG